MFSKKIIFPMAAVAMASFVACGDDSSSSPSTGNLPASVPTLEEAINLTCTPTVNMCAKVYVEEEAVKDTVQCNGTVFTPMPLGKAVEGCENAAATPAANNPSTEDPATTEDTGNPGAAEDPAGPGAAEEPAGPGAAEEPAGPGAAEEPAGPGAAEEPAGPGAGPAAGGDKVYCSKDDSCVEGPAALADECKAEEGETLVQSCPAGGYACEIAEQGITMYFYGEGAEESCTFIKAIYSM